MPRWYGPTLCVCCAGHRRSLPWAEVTYRDSMTGPGPRPPRGRHAAPDDDARPEEAGAGGRHAAGDPAGRRDPEVPGPPGLAGLPGITEPPSRRRRHAAPDDSPTGVTYHRPSLSN